MESITQSLRLSGQSPLSPTLSKVHTLTVCATTQVGQIDTLDANGDGVMDVIALSAVADGSSSQYVRGVNNRYEAREIDLPNGFVAHDVAVGDIDADGDNDVVVSGDSGTSILSNENGQFIIDGANKQNGWSTIAIISR